MTSNKFFNNIQLQNDEIKETIGVLNEEGNAEVYSNESKEDSKVIESHHANFNLLHPLGNHKLGKVVFMRL